MTKQTELAGLLVSILTICECAQAAFDAKRIFLAGVLSLIVFVLAAVALSVLTTLVGGI